MDKKLTLQAFQAEFGGKDEFDAMKGTFTEEDVLKSLDQQNFEANIIKRKIFIKTLADSGWLKQPGILFVFYSIRLLFYDN